MAQGELDIGLRCIKYFLISVSGIFLVTSALVISIGKSIYGALDNVSFVLYDSYFTPATLVIAIGFLMMMLSVFGCIGAVKESTLLVNVFGVFLCVMFLMELTTAMLAYNLRARSNLEEMLYEKFMQTMPKYYEDEGIRDSFDTIQTEFQCCGVYSLYDWRSVEVPEDYEFNRISIPKENLTVPRSCCQSYSDIDENVHSCYVPTTGCLTRVFNWVYQSAYLLTTGAVTVAIIQVLGIFFAFSLARSIRRAKTERARRQWEIKETMINAYSDADKKMAIGIEYPVMGEDVKTY